jgi:hypothetical protein
MRATVSRGKDGKRVGRAGRRTGLKALNSNPHYSGEGGLRAADQYPHARFDRVKPTRARTTRPRRRPLRPRRPVSAGSKREDRTAESARATW